MGVNGIYGLSGSGLDIESLVKMGMTGKNKQYDKMEQQEIANTWLKEAYNDVYSDMTTYKYGTLSTYKMQSNLNAMSAVSSNTGVVTATANGAAAAMNHTVTVDSIASNAYLLTAQHKDAEGKLVNYGVTRSNENAQTSNKLADVLFKEYHVNNEGTVQDGNNTKFKYNITLEDGSTKIVNGEDIAISLKLKDTAGSDQEYTLTYTYDELFSGVKSGDYTGYTGDENTLFSGGKTLNDFASAIAKTGANIQGGYDTANDTFSLYNKTSGMDNIIGITADNGNTATLLNHLNLGVYNASTDELSDRIDFTSDDVMPTTMESTGSIQNVAKSVSLKDVLGLKATSVKNDDGSYTITVRDKANQALGTFTKNGDTITGDTAVAFSMNLSNGKENGNATINFTLGELFNLNDIGKKTNLGGNAGLDELATKISATSLGITANYDAAKDSFSLSNPTGLAELTANGSGANQTTANTLINSLNLATSPKITYLTTSNSSNLASVFGLHTNLSKTGDTYYLQVRDSANRAVGTQSGSNSAIVDDGKALFNFTISDETNTATVTLKFADIANYSAIDHNGGGANNIKVNNVSIKGGDSVDLANPSNNLAVLATRINDAMTAAGMNIQAKFEDGKFSLVNPSGSITITNATGSLVDVSGKLNLSVDEPVGMAYKESSGITRVNKTSTEDSLADAIGLTAVKNSDGTLTVTDVDGNSSVVNVSDAAFSVKVGDSNKQAEVAITYADLFKVDGSGNLKSNFGLGDFVSKVNEVAAANGISVQAAYDPESGKVTLSNDSGYATLTGADTIGSELVSQLGFAESKTTAENREHSWAGTNASVTIDGKSYDNTTNKLTVAGVTYTFLDATKGQKATVSVSQDTDKIVDYMKSFVDDYNKLLDSLNGKLSEKKYSDYKPLSKRQEDEMTEKQIEKWTEKAKSGLLYHNSTIRDLVSAMREAIYTKVDAVDSQYNTLSSIGITSTNTKGHLTLDTDKLRKALAEDPDCVYQLFASDQDSTYIAGSTNKNKITNSQKREDYANTGVANRLYNVMTNYMDKISDIAGTSKETDDQSYLGKMITDMKTRMSTFKTQMTAYENKLFKRYDAMEVALSRISAQLSYITSSFS